MFTKPVLTVLLAAYSLADPIPAPQGGSEQSSLDAALASASSFMNIFSDAPTLPASVASVIATAIPTTIQASAVGCEIATSTPGWYKSLPADVKSAFSSYQSAAESWYSVHSSQLGDATSGLPPAPCKATGTAAKSGAASATETGGAAAASNTSKGAAPRATGAIVASLGGVLGVFGLMVAL
jgi:hypothetical protein